MRATKKNVSKKNAAHTARAVRLFNAALVRADAAVSRFESGTADEEGVASFRAVERLYDRISSREIASDDEVLGRCLKNASELRARWARKWEAKFCPNDADAWRAKHVVSL